MITLCHIDDIDNDAAKSFELDDRTVFAVKKYGQIHLYVNSCPHIGIPLEFLPDDFLDRDKNYILCANHGALFEIDSGECISGPCSGQSLEPVPFRIDDGLIRLL